MKIKLILVGLLLSTPSFATVPNMAIDGTVSTVVTEHPKSNHNLTSVTRTTRNKQIELLHITLSNQAKVNLAQNASAQLKHAAEEQIKPTVNASSASKVDLGMNGVPVLDQGAHGTCATFSSTAAIDAAYSKGDYISQLCNLQLGVYLHQKDNSYYSGWDGAYIATIIGQIEKYGIISMDYQHSVGCSGVKDYPLDGGNTEQAMSDYDFTSHSQKILKNISTNTVSKKSSWLSPFDSPDAFLENVKNELRAGHRLIIGTLLDVYVGEVGATGKYHQSYDSWILTPEIEQDAHDGLIDAGHAMVITGYDDNAVIEGPNNTKHVGVIILRNSWGPNAGDNGTYYMSYAYFKTFLFEATAVSEKK